MFYYLINDMKYDDYFKFENSIIIFFKFTIGILCR